MKIEVKDVKIDNEWDYQKGKLLLDMAGSSGIELKQEDFEFLKKEITLFLWRKVKEQFPGIEKFCKGRYGGFNKIEKRNFGTPIINIYGNFYLQLIAQNNRNNWIWVEVDLEPYRFFFNEEGYLKNQIVDAANKLIMKGSAKKEIFEKLISELNEIKTQDSVILIDKKGEVRLEKTENKYV